jgi:hypothetical protein
MRREDRWPGTPWRAVDSSAVIHFKFDERKLQYCGVSSLETEILVFAVFARGPTPGFLLFFDFGTFFFSLSFTLLNLGFSQQNPSNVAGFLLS